MKHIDRRTRHVPAGAAMRALGFAVSLIGYPCTAAAQDDQHMPADAQATQAKPKTVAPRPRPHGAGGATPGRTATPAASTATSGATGTAASSDSAPWSETNVSVQRELEQSHAMVPTEPDTVRQQNAMRALQEAAEARSAAAAAAQSAASAKSSADAAAKAADAAVGAATSEHR